MMIMCGTPVESAARWSKLGDGRQTADGKSGAAVVSGGGHAVGAGADLATPCACATAARYAARPAARSIPLNRAAAASQSTRIGGVGREQRRRGADVGHGILTRRLNGHARQAGPPFERLTQIGRASCRERV